MSWLGVNLNESLKNIGGQISNLTREVLSDELDGEDENREILVSYKKFNELQSRSELQNREILSLRNELDETKERLSASDYGYAQTSETLKKKLAVYEEELHILREERSMWDWEEIDSPDEQLTLLKKKLTQQKNLHQQEIRTLLSRSDSATISGSTADRCPHTCTAAETQSKDDSWNREKQNLVSKISDLERSNASLKEENEAFQENLQALEQEHLININALQKHKKELAQNLENAKTNHKKSQNVTKAEHKKVLESTIAQHKKKIEDLERNHKRDSKKDASREKIASLQKQIENLLVENKSKDVTISELQKSKDEVVTARDNLQHELTQLQQTKLEVPTIELDRVKVLMNQLEETKNETNQKQQASALTLMEKTKELAEAQHKVNELTSLIKQLEERIRTLDDDNHEQVKDMLRKQKDLDETIEKMRQETEQMREKKKSDEKELEEERKKKVQLEESVSKDRERHDKLRNELWEKEKEIQALREQHQKEMLDIESSSSPVEGAPITIDERALLFKLREQLKETTNLLKASDARGDELQRENEDLRDQLEATEEIYGRTPPDGGVCPPIPPTSSMSPSRLLHTIDESEEEATPSSNNEIEIIGEVALHNGVMGDSPRQLHTIMEENREGDVVTEGRMRFVEGDSDAARVEREQNLVHHLEEGDGEEDSCSQCSKLMTLLKSTQSQLETRQVELIYKKDQYDNLLEAIQDIGTAANLDESPRAIHAFCEALEAKVKHLENQKKLFETQKRSWKEENQATVIAAFNSFLATTSTEGNLDDVVLVMKKMIEIIHDELLKLFDDKPDFTRTIITVSNKLQLNLFQLVNMDRINNAKEESKSKLEEKCKKCPELEAEVARITEEKNDLAQIIKELSDEENREILQQEMDKDVLKKANENLVTINNQLTQTLHDKEIEIKKLLTVSEELTVAREDLAKNTAQITSMKEELAKREGIVEEKMNLEEDMKKLTAKHDEEVKKETSALDDDKQQLIDEKECLLLSVTELKKETEELNARIEELENLVKVEEERKGSESEEDDFLKVEHDSLKNEHCTVKQQLNCLQTEHDALKNEHDSLKNEHDAFKTELDALKTEHDSMKTECGSLKTENDSLNSEHDSLKTDHDSLKTDHDSLKTKHDSLKTEHDSLKTEHDSLKTEHDSLKTEHDSLKTEHDSLKTEHDSLKTEHDSLKTEHDSLKTEHDSLKTEHDSLKNEHDSLKTEHDSLKTEHDSLKAKHDSLKTEHDSLKTEHDSLRIKYDSLKIENDSIKTDYNSLKTECDSLKTENNSSKIIHDSSKIELDSLKNEHDSLRIKHDSLKSEYDSLKSEYDSLKTEYDSLKTEHDSSKTENDSLRINHNSLKTEYDSLKTELDSLKTEHDSLKTEHDSLKTEHDSLKTEHDSLKTEHDSLKTEHDSLKTEHDSSKTAPPVLSEFEYDSLKVEHQSLKSKLEDLTSKLAEKTSEVVEVEAKLTDCQDKLSEFQQGVSVLQAERQQMVNALTQKHQESVAYHSEIQRLSVLMEKMTSDHSSEVLRLTTEVSNLQLSSGEVETLRTECESLREKLRGGENSSAKISTEKLKLTQERDQLMLANSQFNAQYEELTKELGSLQERLDKSSKECERLRSHLLTMEEQHTSETVTAREANERLKQTNAQLQEKLQAHSVLFSATSERTSSTVEQLQKEVSSLQLQREELSIHLQQVEEEMKSHKEAATTLQQVLSDFQQSQSRLIAEAVQEEMMKAKKYTQDSAKLTAELLQLKGELAGLQQLQLQFNELQSTVQTKEQSVRNLQYTIARQEDVLKSTKNEMTLMKKSSDERVDKTLIRNLFMGYLSSTSHQQQQVLPVLATVLGLTNDERTRVGLTKDGMIGGKSWMSSIADFLAPPAANVRITSKVDVLDQASLTQAFARFLEEESQPKIQPRLPAVKMAEETEQRAKNKAQGNALVSAASTAPPVASLPLQPPLEEGVEGGTESSLLSNILNNN